MWSIQLMGIQFHIAKFLFDIIYTVQLNIIDNDDNSEMLKKLFLSFNIRSILQ